MAHKNTLETLLSRTKTSIDGCWEWQGCLNGKGYGSAKWNGREQTVHRIFYVAFIGPVPHGKELHHKCDNRRCVKPSHLVPLTRKEHIRLSQNAAWPFIDAIRCKNGHEYTPENTHIRSDGGRRCLTCVRIKDQQYKAKNPDRYKAMACQRTKAYRARKKAAESQPG